MSTLRRLRERTGVRAASALAAGTAVAMVLVVAGVALVLLLDRTLQNNTRDALQQNAEQLATRVGANFSSSGDPKRNAIDATGKRTDVVQIVTAYSDETNAPDWMVGSNGDGQDVQVIGSSEPLDGVDPIVGWLLAPGETRAESDVPVTYRNGADSAGADEMATENMMVVGLGARAQGRPITVYAAQELGPVHQAVETVGLMAAIGVPVLVLVAGFFTYLFAGRALSPVEDMRARVAGMGDRDLSARVPEPASRDEVGRLARTMNQMLGRIESSQATQRRFVADASHELRSPLATVSTGLELLGTGMAADSPDRATVETLRGETARLTGLVEGLLFLARADERGLTPRREEVDLDEIVEAERVRPSGATSVAVRVTTEPARVVGDRGQLVRVVRNLVDNAKRHAASVVAVSVRVADGVAVIDVDDDGNGVPDADRARVFERFVRLDEARARGDGGSGLGLSIVSELLAAHGGTVAALEAPELGGARFRVTVPAVSAPVPDDGATSPAVDGDAGSSSRTDDPGGSGEPGHGAGTGSGVGTDAAGGPEGLRGVDGAGGVERPGGTDRDGDTGRDGDVEREGSPEWAGATAETGWAGRVVHAAAPDAPVRGAAAPAPAGPSAPAASPASAAPGTSPTPSVPVTSPRSPADGAGAARPPARTGSGREPDPAAAPGGARVPRTSPLPIRPDTVGSPYDENATRPIPVVRDGPPAPRGGTAVADRATASPARSTAPAARDSAAASRDAETRARDTDPRARNTDPWARDADSAPRDGSPAARDGRSAAGRGASRPGGRPVGGRPPMQRRR